MDTNESYSRLCQEIEAEDRRHRPGSTMDQITNWVIAERASGADSDEARLAAHRAIADMRWDLPVADEKWRGHLRQQLQALTTCAVEEILGQSAKV